jgi:hypothetical protein
MNNYELLYQNALLADASDIDFSPCRDSNGVLSENNPNLKM